MRNIYKITTYSLTILLSVAFGFLGDSSHSFDLFTTLFSVLTLNTIIFFIMLPTWMEKEEVEK